MNMIEIFTVFVTTNYVRAVFVSFLTFFRVLTYQSMIRPTIISFLMLFRYTALRHAATLQCVIDRDRTKQFAPFTLPYFFD